MTRVGAENKIIAESGLLELEPIETAAKYEFLYRRGIIMRPTRTEFKVSINLLENYENLTMFSSNYFQLSTIEKSSTFLCNFIFCEFHCVF